MQILKLNQTKCYSTKLQTAEVSARVNALLDKSKQTAPNWLSGSFKIDSFDIENGNGAYHLTPKITGKVSNSYIELTIRPSFSFRTAIILSLILNLMLVISMIFDFLDNSIYILAIPVVNFLIFNLEGNKNYNSLISILERALELTKV